MSFPMSLWHMPSLIHARDPDMNQGGAIVRGWATVPTGLINNILVYKASYNYSVNLNYKEIFSKKILY